jgi:hypothetical protein
MSTPGGSASVACAAATIGRHATHAASTPCTILRPMMDSHASGGILRKLLIADTDVGIFSYAQTLRIFVLQTCKAAD